MEETIRQMQSLVTAYGMKVIGAIATLIIGIWIAKWLARISGKVLNKRNVDPTLTKFASSVVKVALITFVIISAISQVGIETTSFVAVIGAAGLAVGFALQGSLSNFASGLMLIIFKPIKVGNYIEGGGASGTVESIGIFVTTLTTPDNKVIYIPNSALTGNNIVNYSTKDTRRVDMVFGIGYSDDIDNAKSVIKSILENDNRILKEPSTQIVLSELADSSVNIVVRPWVNSKDYWPVYFDTTETVKKKFDEHNISIPFPQRDIHLFQEK